MHGTNIEANKKRLSAIRPKNVFLLDQLFNTCRELFSSDVINSIVEFCKQKKITALGFGILSPFLSLPIITTLIDKGEANDFNKIKPVFEQYLQVVAMDSNLQPALVINTILSIIRGTIVIPNQKYIGITPTNCKLTFKTTYVNDFSNKTESSTELVNILKNDVDLLCNAQMITFKCNTYGNSVKLTGSIFNNIASALLVLQTTMTKHAQDRQCLIKPFLFVSNTPDDYQ